MTMTTKNTRKRAADPTPDDHTLCDVDVTPGRAVYWDGEQREGTLRGVPKHIATDWLKAGHANAVHEPK
jgi:hypothetical protein